MIPTPYIRSIRICKYKKVLNFLYKFFELLDLCVLDNITCKSLRSLSDPNSGTLTQNDSTNAVLHEASNNNNNNFSRS